MVRRSTRGRAPRRGILTFLAVSLGVFALFVAGSVAGTAGGLLAAYNYYSTGLPDPHLLDGIDLPASTYVYDRTGQTLLARFECQNREQVSFRELPDDIVNATVAIEDKTFWTNDGIDYSAVVRAALANLEAGGTVQGASTITAQVIKYAGSIKEQQAANHPNASAAPSIALDPSAEPTADPGVCAPPNLTFLAGRTYEDKIREFILARQMTEAYPGRAGKEKILETYMNLVFYGNGSYGIKAAAANYFGISDLSKLTLSQSAFLAGLSQLPSVYDPYYNDNGPERAIARRNDVLDAMLRDGYITARQAADAKRVTWEEMGPGSGITSILREPHFSFRVQREAEAILAAQGVANPAEAVRTGGYRIITTLDYGLQQQATAEVQYWVNCLQGNETTKPGKPRCINKNVYNGALVAIDSATGEIIAYVGSVDYYNREDPKVQGQFDVAGLGKRQPGSAFKPITYSSAFQAREATPATFFVDSVIQYGSNLATSYIPTNADVQDHGPLLALDAIHYSLNVPSVQMQYLVGEDVTAKFAERMGIASADYINGRDPGLTLTLGSVEVNLTNMTSAYGVFAEQGTRHPPTTILEIRDRNNRIIYSIDDNGPEATQPMTPAESYLMHWILKGNTEPRTNLLWGSRAELRDPSGVHREAGFKTGTTNNYLDVSGFGYVPGGLVTGVWMGNSDGKTPMSNSFEGLFSADGPLYLWQEFMTTALNQPWDWNDQQPVPVTQISQPDGIVTAPVCRFSGMGATNDCGPIITVPFLDGTVPPRDNVHSEGCFDIVQEVQQDSRRGPEFVAAAQRWADRFVNDELKSKGASSQIGTLGPEKVWLAITPVPGSGGFGAPICGEVRETPAPTPDESGNIPGASETPRPCRGRKCTPLPSLPLLPGDAPSATLDAAGFVPVFLFTGLLGMVPLIAGGVTRVRRRRR